MLKKLMIEKPPSLEKLEEPRLLGWLKNLIQPKSPLKVIFKLNLVLNFISNQITNAIRTCIMVHFFRMKNSSGWKLVSMMAQ